MNNSFQEVIPGLFIGSQSALSSPYPLIAKKITHLLGINNYKDRHIGFTMKVLGLEDQEDTDILSYFQECIDFINSANKILVFCAAGRSRSATIVAAYLIKEKQMTLNEALITINRVRAVRPNEGFLKQLEHWEKIAGCKTCRVLNDSEKVFEEDDFVCVLCPACQFPMAILKSHSGRKTSDLHRSVESILLDIVNKFCCKKNFKIQVSSNPHFSWHATLENSTCGLE